MSIRRSARKRKKVDPYHGTQWNFNDFYVLKHLSIKLIINILKFEHVIKVNWLLIKMLQFSKSMPPIIEYNHLMINSTYLNVIN